MYGSAVLLDFILDYTIHYTHVNNALPISVNTFRCDTKTSLRHTIVCTFAQVLLLILYVLVYFLEPQPNFVLHCYYAAPCIWCTHLFSEFWICDWSKTLCCTDICIYVHVFDVFICSVIMFHLATNTSNAIKKSCISVCSLLCNKQVLDCINASIEKFYWSLSQSQVVRVVLSWFHIAYYDLEALANLMNYWTLSWVT